MGIFTRFRDIVGANINAMLDSAEDPEKLIRLMIREMEDTLVEMKSSCAGVMATRKQINREMDEKGSQERFWEERAQLAVSKSRDDLAREALLEKRRLTQRAASLVNELAELDGLVETYQTDIRQLTDKLNAAREKQRILVQRHIQANGRKRAQQEIRRMDTSDAIFRFEEFERRIEQTEAEADWINHAKQADLDEKFDELMVDDEIEQELASLKSTSPKREEVSPA